MFEQEIRKCNPYAGYLQAFVRKINQNDEIMLYKSQLITLGFLQKTWIDYENAYYLMMDAIMFKFLISSVDSLWLDMSFIDVVTVYPCSSLDKWHIYENLWNV